MSNILIISGHPDLTTSNANKAILDAVRARFGDNVKIRELDKLRVNGKFDVPAEQKALVEADVIVLQFPVMWYSISSLLKQWIDDVFEYGFAYGENGTALQGKKLLISATAGAIEDVYRTMLPRDVSATLTEFENTAAFTGMPLEEPLYSCGTTGDPDNPAVARAIGEDHGKRLIERLEALGA